MAIQRVLTHTGDSVAAPPRPTAAEFITRLEWSAAHKSLPLVAKDLAIHRDSFARNHSCTNSLACAARRSDPCDDRGHHSEKENPTMTTFTIDPQNNITAFGSTKEAKD